MVEQNERLKFSGYHCVAILVGFKNMRPTRPLCVSQYNDEYSTTFDFIKLQMVVLGIWWQITYKYCLASSKVITRKRTSLISVTIECAFLKEANHSKVGRDFEGINRAPLGYRYLVENNKDVLLMFF